MTGNNFHRSESGLKGTKKKKNFIFHNPSRGNPSSMDLIYRSVPSQCK